MHKKHIQHLLVLLLATLFISTSGVLGKYIKMSPEVIIWFRSSLAMLFLYAFCKFKKVKLTISSSNHYTPFIISSVFMAMHWITYFYALKLSNVALGMLSLYTFPIITTLLEPVVFKTKFNPVHIVLAMLVLIGIYILSPDFNLGNSNVQGILMGLLSALFYAIRILILKPFTANYNGTMLMFYQTLIITVFLSPVLLFMDFLEIVNQFPYVLLLALLTTAIGHSLMVRSLKFFTVSTASIISSIQPVFGVVLAYAFLNEIPTWKTFIGGGLILTTVIIESVTGGEE
ncbi:EamA family transporter [Tenacibaculum maritimum]|uniref:DMT family transporter n=1 Tax=Tenacibaculum maritimum TaxID=107401 RepID=UPI003876DA4C